MVKTLKWSYLRSGARWRRSNYRPLIWSGVVSNSAISSTLDDLQGYFVHCELLKWNFPDTVQRLTISAHSRSVWMSVLFILDPREGCEVLRSTALYVCLSVRPLAYLKNIFLFHETFSICYPCPWIGTAWRQYITLCNSDFVDCDDAAAAACCLLSLLRVTYLLSARAQSAGVELPVCWWIAWRWMMSAYVCCKKAWNNHHLLHCSVDYGKTLPSTVM